MLDFYFLRAAQQLRIRNDGSLGILSILIVVWTIQPTMPTMLRSFSPKCSRAECRLLTAECSLVQKIFSTKSHESLQVLAPAFGDVSGIIARAKVIESLPIRHKLDHPVDLPVVGIKRSQS